MADANISGAHGVCAFGGCVFLQVRYPCHPQVWRMRKFPGDTEYALSAEVEMSARIEDKRAWSRPPISMEYQVSPAQNQT